MTMQVMTAKEAKNSFGKLMISAVKEPVIITKNNKPLHMLVTIEDLKGTHFEDFFMEKEEGHDEWVQAKVSASLHRLQTEGSKGRSADEVHSTIMEKVRLKLASKA